MTAQAAEDIFFDGEKFALMSLPTLPQGHERFTTRTPKAALQSLPRIDATGHRRRYVGTWEILYGKFYLRDIVGIYKLTPGPSLEAIWFTGTLRVVSGDCVSFFHGGFVSKYATEMFFDVEKGKVKGMRVERNADPDRIGR